MTRYLRLYLYFLQFSFSKAMEFRLDFSFRIIMDIVYSLVNVLFFKILFLHSNLIAGWREDQMLIFVASYVLVDAISMTVFSTNMWWLPYQINKGELDYHLIRPVSPLFFLSLREFSANSFMNLLISIGLLTYALTHYADPYSFSDVLLLIALLINGALIYYCCQMLMILPVFWTQSARGFMDLFYSMGIAMERPDRIFKGWLRILFTIFLPFALIASFPVRIFIEKFNWTTMLHLMGVSIFLWVLMLSIWRRGLRAYSSASS